MSEGNGRSWAWSGISVKDLPKLGRLAAVKDKYETKHDVEKERKQGSLRRLFNWWAGWSIPGLGMFSEAYIIFSIGLIKPLQSAMYPSCFDKHTTCTAEETKVTNYVQIGGIIIGMLFFGTLGDFIGRAWGSRIVATIMLSGSIMLVFSPFVPDPLRYLRFFIFAQTFYGFGVGGEYPMASSSAAERSQSDPELRNRRGEQVVLTFSQQGMGNFVNGWVILILMAIYHQTGTTLDSIASRNIISVQFAAAAAVSVFMVVWRYTKLKESEVWKAEREDALDIAAKFEHQQRSSFIYKTALKHFGPRLFVTSMAWVANDFAFYGNKLFQSNFIKALYPTATPYERMQWTVLNSAISLTGYWLAAALIDKPWYGRQRMQTIGFMMMFILFIICGGAYAQLTSSAAGYHAFQALYFLSSFFNQFGPNCVTWLVAAEVFPTDVRATFQGTSAAWGKVGAIVADIVFGYVSTQTTFYLSAAFGLFGAIITWLFLPNTTGLSLDETDRLHKYMLTDEFHHYHGEAVNPKHLSNWERWTGWAKHYDPAADAAHQKVQAAAAEEHRKHNLEMANAANGADATADFGGASAGAHKGAQE